MTDFYRNLWMHFFKWPIDNLAISNGAIYSDSPYNRLREWFYDAKWNEVYDLVEFIVSSYDNELFPKTFNFYLKREFSAYRFVGNSLVEINSEEEIIEIEKAINTSDKYNPVKIHINSALHLISDKKNPDYRNSVKESISAVESLCRIIINEDNVTLGAALKVIESRHNIPESLKKGFSSIYGFTSDKGGIRHGLLNGDIKIGIDEARFMVIACSTFINYLISKVE